MRSATASEQKTREHQERPWHEKEQWRYQRLRGPSHRHQKNFPVRMHCAVCRANLGRTVPLALARCTQQSRRQTFKTRQKDTGRDYFAFFGRASSPCEGATPIYKKTPNAPQEGIDLVLQLWLLLSRRHLARRCFTKDILGYMIICLGNVLTAHTYTCTKKKISPSRDISCFPGSRLFYSAANKLLSSVMFGRQSVN